MKVATTPSKKARVNLLKIILLFNGNTVVSQSFQDYIREIFLEIGNAKDVALKVVEPHDLGAVLERGGQSPAFVILMPELKGEAINIAKRLPPTTRLLTLWYPLEERIEKLRDRK